MIKKLLCVRTVKTEACVSWYIFQQSLNSKKAAARQNRRSYPLFLLRYQQAMAALRSTIYIQIIFLFGDNFEVHAPNYIFRLI